MSLKVASALVCTVSRILYEELSLVTVVVQYFIDTST